MRHHTLKNLGVYLLAQRALVVFVLLKNLTFSDCMILFNNYFFHNQGQNVLPKVQWV